jgi:glycosyltransferase involved in cell wall biosynthesis
MKKIIVDAYQHTEHITGTDRMSKNILDQLQILDTKNKYYVFCNSQYQYISNCIKGKNFKILYVRPGKYRITKARNKIIDKARSLQIAHRIKPDVYYSFHNMKTPPIHTAKKTISSVLDLIPIQFTEYQTSKEHSKDAYIKRYNETIRLSDSFIAISEHSKKALHTELGVPNNKIKVMPLAVDKSFRSPSIAEQERVRQKYNLPPKFVFCVGGSEPRKNVISIVNAYNFLAPEVVNEYPLVVAGGKWRSVPLTILQKPFVNLVGFVEEEDFPAFYALASVFVFPSLSEGFGFTVLEAMACKTPVACSTTSSLPEVAETAVRYFNPLAPKEISEAITFLLQEKNSKEYVERGLKQIEVFSWKKTTSILLEEMLKD